MKGQKGFTLIELLVVIAIMSFLSSMVFGSLQAAREKARSAAKMHQLKEIQTSLELYYTKHGQYPPSHSPTGWELSLGMWVVDCSVNPSDSNPSGFIIPELIEDGDFTGVKEQRLEDCTDGSYDGYTYGSNGRDYKLLIRDKSITSADKGLIDPATDNPDLGDMCSIDGTDYQFYGVWTLGATCWLQRWQCDMGQYCLSPGGDVYN